ncbi:winged helix-turn-helix domain-containing protein [Penaeicola halotolerans]|uniref:winged helix-turn-helix domain-containing protein n=1 Tax=Penaeicola halotolerans TaxID=2793196 RepID=UPI001CF91D46|nr:transcriptional regulator [Penaeicola halotolerans]
MRYKILNPLLHAQLRLGIMSILMSESEADFVYLKNELGASSGNLSVQLNKLKQAGYISLIKTFNGNLPQTIVRIEEAGVSAFSEYLSALKDYLIYKK